MAWHGSLGGSLHRQGKQVGLQVFSASKVSLVFAVFLSVGQFKGFLLVMVFT